MKKSILLIVVGLLIASSSSAVVDPKVNSMGMYFDMNADVVSFDTAPYVMVPVHVILTNPDFDALFGYEFGYRIEGNHMVSATTLMGDGPIDVGGEPGNHIVGLAAPMATAPATVVCTLSIFVLDDAPIYFIVTGATPNSVIDSNRPAILLDDDVIIATRLAASDIEFQGPLVCAAINDVPATADRATFGQVKCLYR